jgi:hypothetical protein
MPVASSTLSVPSKRGTSPETTAGPSTPARTEL